MTARVSDSGAALVICVAVWRGPVGGRWSDVVDPGSARPCWGRRKSRRYRDLPVGLCGAPLASGLNAWGFVHGRRRARGCSADRSGDRFSAVGALRPRRARADRVCRHGVARVVGDRIRGRCAAAGDRLARAAAAARLLVSGDAHFRAARRAVRDRWPGATGPSPRPDEAHASRHAGWTLGSAVDVDVMAPLGYAGGRALWTRRQTLAGSAHLGRPRAVARGRPASTGGN